MEKELMQVVGAENVKCREKMAKHTTFRIGGEVTYFVTPANVRQLLCVIKLCKDKDIPCEIIGNGSNLLVTDEPVEGAIISLYRRGREKPNEACDGRSEKTGGEERNPNTQNSDIQNSDTQNPNIQNADTDTHKIRIELEDMDLMDIRFGEEAEIAYQGQILAECKEVREKDEETCRGGYVVAGAGVMLAKLASFAGEHALGGLAFASGIPGTLGGAVAMNAGAYGGEIKDTIVGAVVMKDNGDVAYLEKQELGLSYRNSTVLENNYTVLAALFYLEQGSRKEILADMKKYNASRREKQPLEYASAGSTFKRPQGYFAGKLIQDAGLKGYRIGDIMVSEKHSGFVVNVGNGTAKEVLQVVTHVQEEVRRQFGVELEMEVKTIGL